MPASLESLDLTCYKCTRVLTLSSDDFQNFTMAAAVQMAKERGWVMDGERFVCPKCLTSKRIPSFAIR